MEHVISFCGNLIFRTFFKVPIAYHTGLRPIYVMFFKFLPISFQMKNDDLWL